MEQQAVGNIVGMEQRSGGWVAVAIAEPGKQYPLKLSTKRAELIQQAQQMLGQLVTAGYNEQESTNINPHNGQPYVNRYLEALSMGAVDIVGAPTQIQPQQYMPQPPHPMQNQPVYTQPQRASRQDEVEKIHRQSAAKVAVNLLPLLDTEHHNLASLVRISEQLVKYFNEGVQWQVPPPAPQPQYQGDPGPQGIPHDGYEDFSSPQEYFAGGPYEDEITF